MDESELQALNQMTTPQLLELMKKISDSVDYVYNGHSYSYYDVPREHWIVLKERILRKFPRWRRRLTGGFVLGEDIFIDKQRTRGRDKLIVHEIGHTLGYGHTWKPTIMNPTWLLRWFNRF